MDTKRKYRNLAIFLTTLAVAITITGGPDPAESHNITPNQCQRSATNYVRSHPPATIQKWRRAYRKCQRRAQQHQLRHLCTGRRPMPLIGRITAKHQPASLHQRRNVTTALNLAKRMRSPYNHRIAVIAAATQEQGLGNYPRGMGTSVGFLQLIDSHENDGDADPVNWRMQVVNSAGWFLRGARKIDPSGSMAPGVLAQAVQASAYPDAYHQWVTEARRTYAVFTAPCRV